MWEITRPPPIAHSIDDSKTLVSIPACFARRRASQ